MYSIKTTQKLPISLKKAWDFFSDPRNLSRITPPHMRFEILSELPERVYSGLIIIYTVRPLLGIPLKWVTEINHVKEGELFVDSQLSGPYHIWHHQHHFKENEEGVEMTDIVHYELPLGFIGRMAHTLFIRKKVEQIFIYREKILKGLF